MAHISRLAPCLLAVLAACGGPQEVAWIRLAVGFQPAGTPVAGQAFGGDGLRVWPGPAGDSALWLGFELERSSWEEVAAAPGIWVASRGLGNVHWMQRASTEVELLGPDGGFDFVPFTRDMGDIESVADGSFGVVLDEIILRLEPGEEPPEACTYRMLLERGRTAEGEDAACQVSMGYVLADGLAVWPGFQEQLAFSGLAGPSTLRCTTGTIAASASALAERDEPSGQVRFRVLLDGVELFVEEQEVLAGAHFVGRELPLPADVRAGTLSFETEGDAALCAFLEPVLGPAAPPEQRERPDVVLLLLDTFRADNLAAYGGTLGLTPELDALALDSLVMRRAWSPAVWTLPSQASMMSGVYPPEHGTVREQFSIPLEVETIAERFAAAGYRTGAVTDGVLVSRRHGFDQGFQWFDEEWEDEFEETNAVVERFLAQGDGRPTFLFVQSYRAHQPYRVSDETRRVHGPRLGLEGEFEEVHGRLDAGSRDRQLEGGPIAPERADDVRRLRALYRAGVIDLDRGVGALLERLGAHGLRSNGYLLVTADHGEAFGEHELLGHAGGVWEEQIRIPLLVNGPGLRPRLVEHPASLVDVPATLAALADIPSGKGWGGEPLSELDHDRPAFSFECGPTDEKVLAVVAGRHKLIAPHDRERLAVGDALHVFELTQDPGETRDLLGTAQDVSGDILRQLGPQLEQLLEARFPSAESKLGHEDEEALRALGYGSLVGEE